MKRILQRSATGLLFWLGLTLTATAAGEPLVAAHRGSVDAAPEIRAWAVLVTGLLYAATKTVSRPKFTSITQIRNAD